MNTVEETQEKARKAEVGWGGIDKCAGCRRLQIRRLLIEESEI